MPADTPLRLPAVPDLSGARATVLFSGGQDSTTSLFWALAPRSAGGAGFGAVDALAFDYGQRHAVEIRQARRIAGLAGVDLTVLTLDGLLGGSALLESEAAATSEPHALAPDLPASFVPARNALFLTVAAGHAWRRRGGGGAVHLVGGMCETDYSGYPDCRQGFVESQARTLSLGLDADVQIWTPLMHLTKAETWKLAADLGTVATPGGPVAVLDTVCEHSHTDYHGDRSQRHAWGYGRLDNPASVLRARGWDEAAAKGWV